MKIFVTVGGFFISKKIFIILIIIVLIIICGIYLYDTTKKLTLNDYFDSNSEYNSSWDNISKTIQVKKEFSLKFNQTYKNITTKLHFYKDSRLLKTVSVINSTKDGKLIVSTSVELNEEPNNIVFDIVEGKLVESDKEGLEYGENFYWFK